MNKNSFAPLPTSTRSAATSTCLLADSSTAITSRNSARPALGV